MHDWRLSFVAIVVHDDGDGDGYDCTIAMMPLSLPLSSECAHLTGHTHSTAVDRPSRLCLLSCMSVSLFKHFYSCLRHSPCVCVWCLTDSGFTFASISGGGGSGED